MRHSRTGLSHFVFPAWRVFPAPCSRSGILSVHEDEPLSPARRRGLFMRAVLCATGAASAGFAGQRLEPVLSQVAGTGYSPFPCEGGGFLRRRGGPKKKEGR